MERKHVWMAMVAVLVCSMATGCAVYSQQRYGPVNMGAANDLKDCLAKSGGPDLVQQSGGSTICVYRIIDAMQVLGVYGYVEKRDRVMVFDTSSGKKISDDYVEKGKGMFILGMMSPAFETE